MADIGDANLQMDSQFTEQEYQFQAPSIISQTFIGDSTTIITTINGAGGPNINFSSSIGFSFTGGGGGTVTMVVSDAALVRTSIGAAKSGANSDLTSFSALTGNGGVNPWTGTPNGATQSTYPATVASVGYVQAEMQGLMDKMQDVTEFMMFLVAALLAPGVVET